MNLEFWELAIDGTSAIATLAAVGLSLWLTVRKTPRFKIRDIQVSCTHNLDKNYTIEKAEYSLVVKIENCLDVQMQVFSIEIHHTLKPATGYGLLGDGSIYPQANLFIPPRSQYFVRVPLNRDWSYHACTKAQKIECKISTSFGDQATDFPKKWVPQLANAVEKKDGP